MARTRAIRERTSSPRPTACPDILEVGRAVCKEVGLLRPLEHGARMGVNIVPLFETIGDLANAGPIMDPAALDPALQPVALKSFAGPSQNDLAPLGAAQTNLRAGCATGLAHQAPAGIMLGYSDSNKDGGFFTSQLGAVPAPRLRWSSCSAPATASRLRLFHGRGGIGRPRRRAELPGHPGPAAGHGATGRSA
jgi:phosphoenolpyruvate carboxylase